MQPTLKGLTDTVSLTNDQLTRVDTITSSVSTMTTNASALTSVAAATIGSPLIKVAAFSYGVRTAVARPAEGEGVSRRTVLLAAVAVGAGYAVWRLPVTRRFVATVREASARREAELREAVEVAVRSRRDDPGAPPRRGRPTPDLDVEAGWDRDRRPPGRAHGIRPRAPTTRVARCRPRRPVPSCSTPPASELRRGRARPHPPHAHPEPDRATRCGPAYDVACPCPVAPMTPKD